jgi:hypothetical protein
MEIYLNSKPKIINRLFPNLFLALNSQNKILKELGYLQIRKFLVKNTLIWQDTWEIPSIGRINGWWGYDKRPLDGLSSA